MEPVPIVSQDLVSFAFDAQIHYDKEKPLFIEAEQPNFSISSNSARQLVKNLIAGLQSRGLRKGDAVMVCIGNHYLYPVIFFSIIGAGGVVCPANPAYLATELDHIFQLSAPRFIITGHEALPTVLDVCRKRSMLASNVFILDGFLTAMNSHKVPNLLASFEVKGTFDPGDDQANSISDLFSHGQSDWIKLKDEDAAKLTPAAYYVTSGTTGLPKLATLSHYSLIYQHQSIYDQVPYQIVRLACLPIFHIFGAAWALISPVRYGQQVYIMSRFRLEAYVRNIHTYAITETYMAPPMVHALSSSHLPLEYLLSSLRYIGVGGAPIGADAMEKLNLRLSQEATLTQVWGMTEFGPASLFRWGEKHDKSSVGRLLPGYEVKFVGVEGDGRDAGTCNGPGALCIRTPGVMLGYRGITMSAKDKAWFPTGDIGLVKGEMLYITGRFKEMIKVKGWQVAPAELEAVILKHPRVSDCAVVGVSSACGLAETPRAFVVPEINENLDQDYLAKEICEMVQRELVSYKELGGGVIYMEQIPRTASGKTQRHKLLRSSTDTSDASFS